MMDPFLAWVESTDFSTWMRESPSVFAFPAILSCHTVGMGLVAGINAALALRILGVGPAIPIRELKRFMPVMWFGFWLNAISGVALLIAYPTKALTNPDFYLKLGLIAIAVALVKPITRRVFSEASDSPSIANAPTAPGSPQSSQSFQKESGRTRRLDGSPESNRTLPVPHPASAVGAAHATASAVSTTDSRKPLAIASIVCWFSAITAGRLLAYTYTRLMQGF